MAGVIVWAGWPYWVGLGFGVALALLVMGFTWAFKSSVLLRRAWQLEEQAEVRLPDPEGELYREAANILRDFRTVDVVWAAICISFASLVVSLVGVLLVLVGS